MFEKEDCFNLGSIARLHSFKGEVSIFLDVDDPKEFKNLESVFVEIDNILVPFFIESIQIRNKGFAVVRFEDVNSEQKAKRLLKKKLYLPLDILPELDEDEFYHFEVEGFKVVDHEHGPIGNVVKILDHKTNPMFEIDFNGVEILIPKQDRFFERIDWDEEIVYLKAPEGLIEMYLNLDN
ncbi:16S rRNA processing protein RimM [Putridiphycobacter roseus]|uniref:Ribosome maturation factor RimM n=1 Tax=Putridiphycobacter roseus TaxID=2219161 RepID=A0A2W1NPN8_9FLAO|nr:ribosome maturation factor RimM [Putridiphycobacter roseus]PZE17592.1 16S rRNA processing protein RimM [Putridiphycobacter roseus]